MLPAGKWLSFLVPAIPLMLAAGAVQADLLQNFDGGGSPYTLGGLAAVAGFGNPGNGLRLTTPLNGIFGVAAFDLTDPGLHDSIRIDLDFRISENFNNNVDTAADGFGVALIHTGTFGTSGLPAGLDIYKDYEEPNIADSIGVGFDTWDNSGNGSEGNSSVSLHYNGAVLDSVVVFPAMQLENGFYNHASILVSFVPGGANATVSLLDASDNVLETPFNNYFIAGLAPYESRLFLGARTGGFHSAHDIDNISTVYNVSGVPEPSSATFIGFLAVMTLIRRRHH
jgi:hypothetical protein